jgi:hypothetical protein
MRGMSNPILATVVPYTFGKMFDEEGKVVGVEFFGDGFCD